jgi:hypothetical protein
MAVMFITAYAAMSSLMSEEVRVLKILDGSTLLVREVIRSQDEQYDELAFSLEEQKGKVGVIGLAGIKLEPFSDKLYEPELVSDVGRSAYQYLKGRLIGQIWNFEVDNYGEVKQNGGVPYGYLVSRTQAVLNVELVRLGHSPYFFRDEWALRRHVEMAGAQKEAIKNYRGVWSDVERRSFYLKRHKEMSRNKDLRAPSLTDPGEVLENVGEKYSREDVILGVILLMVMMLVKTPLFAFPGKVVSGTVVGTFKLGYKSLKVMSVVTKKGIHLADEAAKDGGKKDTPS